MASVPRQPNETPVLPREVTKAAWAHLRRPVALADASMASGDQTRTRPDGDLWLRESLLGPSELVHSSLRG